MRRARTIEAGFTMVEMIVSMIVLAIAIGALLPSLSNVAFTSDRAAASAHASDDAKNAMGMLTNDLRQAAADRPAGAGGLATDTGASSIVSMLDNSRQGFHDIVVAKPNDLEFWSDVVSTQDDPGTGDAEIAPYAEYVAWKVLTNSVSCGVPSTPTTTSNWCVVREVSYGPAGHTRNTTPTNAMTEVMAKGPGSLPTQTDTCGGAKQLPQLFCYQISGPGASSAGPNARDYPWNAWNSGVISCAQAWLPSMGSLGSRMTTNHSRFVNDSIDKLDTITSVRVSIPSSAELGGQTSTSELTSTIDLRNRTNPDYDTAIECGAR